jgi:predicted nucleotidyltransferase
MKRQRRIPADEWQYHKRASSAVRGTLLELGVAFVRAARNCQGVSRIALVGSVATSKPRPKDIDLLVSVAPNVDLPRLATLARRLGGSAQSKLNSGADVFLADRIGEYLGRACHYRECHPRVLCRARHCGAVPHLADDLDVVTLSPALITAPPIELWPTVVARIPVPDDVQQLLLEPLLQDGQAAR